MIQEIEIGWDNSCSHRINSKTMSSFNDLIQNCKASGYFLTDGYGRNQNWNMQMSRPYLVPV